MRPAEDDVYITVVVMRRPAWGDSADIDPNVLAQSVLQGIRSQGGMYSRSLSGLAWPRWAESTLGPGRVRTGGGREPGTRPAPPRRKWFLLAIAVACWTGAAICFFMLAKQWLVGP